MYCISRAKLNFWAGFLFNLKFIIMIVIGQGFGTLVPTKTTLYSKWNRGEIGNFGSFQTSILQAYQLADSTNQERLETAFPEWFVVKF